MNQNEKAKKPSKRSPIRSYRAAGILQDREPKPSELRAVARLGRVARKNFDFQELPDPKKESLDKLYRKTAYWHGTGRFQRHNGQQVDVLRSILKNGAINPSLDPYVPELGVVESVSLSKPRLYARAYADMHSDKPGALNRFIAAPEVANFYIFRPAVRYMLGEILGHENGMRAGMREMSAKSQERHGSMSQTWQSKVTSQPVKEMQVFRVGSDIPGNYPILFGMDPSINTFETTATIRETREARTAEPIPLTSVTHVEVPREQVIEVTQLFQEAGFPTPVVAIEDMEQLMARQDIGELLLGHQSELSALK